MPMEIGEVTIYIENKPYAVKRGGNLLHACLSLGFDIPYFCWHPALHSIGACRQCAVKVFKDEKDTKGKIVMSCMTPVSDGLHISIDDPEARTFRRSVIEWLMTNHPHDCPVCDEGGECHLQDMTMLTGHIYRRYRFKKRTHRNQYLGPFVNHEMNRCIQCYRCVRFYRDHAGGRDFDVFAAHNDVYFGRHRDGNLENEFSGNLVEICPTGVFTDKTLKKHYTRKWDLQTAPSVCVHCGLGCNTIPGERYGMLRRIQNRYNGEVNGYFLCDRGRYGYEFVNSNRRIRQPLLRLQREQSDGTGLSSAEPVTKERLLQYMSTLFYFGARVIGIGSPRASLEANFMLRSLVGPDRFYLGMSENEYRMISLMADILKKGPAGSASLHDAQLADAVFVLGEDVTNVAPMLALALRQSVRRKSMEKAKKLRIPEWDDYAVREAVQNEKGPLFIATPAGTKLDEIATQSFYAPPDDLARIGFAVAHALNPDIPAVEGLNEKSQSFVNRIAQAFMNAERPLVISGMSCGSEQLIKSAANVAWALCEKGRTADLFFTVPECNTLGLGLIGGGSIHGAFRLLKGGMVDTVLILENDLYRRADEAVVNTMLDSVQHVVVIDHLFSATTSKADVVIPACTFAEATGTLVNSEGRAQRFFKVFTPDGLIQESWRWLLDIMASTGRPESTKWKTFDDISGALAESIPVFNMRCLAPSAGFRITGLKIPRQPHRYSGRTAMSAHVSIDEPMPPNDRDAPFSFSMEGYEGQPPPSLITRFWSPGWNSVQSVSKFQIEAGGPLKGGDPGLRLIEPLHDEKISYFKEVPKSFEPRSDELLIVPFYHIFGSEELSVHAPSVAELIPKPYLGLNPEDAAVLQAADGEEVEITLKGKGYRLPIRITASLPSGVAGLPSGLAELHGVILPVWCRISVNKKKAGKIR